eukprot:COSAG02_NODE_7040_length_3214_cov_2.032745_3_plen_63_part_00
MHLVFAESINGFKTLEKFSQSECNWGLRVTPVERAIRNLAFLPLISDMQIIICLGSDTADCE